MSSTQALIELRQVNPAQKSVKALIDKLDTYQIGLYKRMYCHLDSPEELMKENAYMVGAFAQNNLIGMCALKPLGAYGEVKRLYVEEAWRGKQIASQILVHIETQAKKMGFDLLLLETGVKQPEAIKFYENHGYTQSEPFGCYTKNHVSYFMRKQLPI